MLNACTAAYTADKVTYVSTGSGTGRNEFRGTVPSAILDWAGTDGLYDSATAKLLANASNKNSKFMTVPLLGGPIVFAYSLPAVGDGLQLDSQTVSAIFKGDILSWADPRIAALNPKAKLPKLAKTGYFKVAVPGTGSFRQVKTPALISYVSAATDATNNVTGKQYDYDYKDRYSIRVAYRESGSGTTTNLTRYLNQTSGASWVKDSNNLVTAAGGSTTFAPVSTSFPTSQDLSEYIEDTTYSFGYFDLSDAIAANVGIAKLKNAAGAFVAPSSSAAAKFIAAQSVVTTTTGDQWDIDRTNGTLDIDFTKVVSGAYQLSIVSYGLAPRFENANPKAVSTDANKIAVRKFFEYVVGKCVPANAARLGYVALSGAVKTSALNQIKKIG